MSPAYRAALKAVRAATAKFAKTRDEYRARAIGDEEFLDAKRELADAEDLFDAAHRSEAERSSK